MVVSLSKNMFVLAALSGGAPAVNALRMESAKREKNQVLLADEEWQRIQKAWLKKGARKLKKEIEALKEELSTRTRYMGPNPAMTTQVLQEGVKHSQATLQKKKEFDDERKEYQLERKQLKEELETKRQALRMLLEKRNVVHKPVRKQKDNKIQRSCLLEKNDLVTILTGRRRGKKGVVVKVHKGQEEKYDVELIELIDSEGRAVLTGHGVTNRKLEQLEFVRSGRDLQIKDSDSEEDW